MDIFNIFYIQIQYSNSIFNIQIQYSNKMIKLNGSLLAFILFSTATFLFLYTNLTKMKTIRQYKNKISKEEEDEEDEDEDEEEQEQSEKEELEIGS